jgi:hypothetical protein
MSEQQKKKKGALKLNRNGDMVINQTPNMIGSGKAKKEVSKTCKAKETGNGKKVVHDKLNNFLQNSSSNLAKILLSNQENNFIEKKLKECTQQNKKPNLLQSQIIQNKSQSNIHKSSEKSMNAGSNVPLTSTSSNPYTNAAISTN